MVSPIWYVVVGGDGCDMLPNWRALVVMIVTCCPPGGGSGSGDGGRKLSPVICPGKADGPGRWWGVNRGQVVAGGVGWKWFVAVASHYSVSS